MRAHLASLVDDFRAHAAETAVVSHRGVRRYATTYGELAELAGRFAAELQRRAIRPGERIVLWGADSAEWIGVFFGCLLRGVIVVPLDAAGNTGFAAEVVRDVGARLVVGDRALLAALASSQSSVLRAQLPAMELRGIGERMTGEPLWTVTDAVGLDTPFQIVFTSGTTSEPRGVVHTHRNVLVTLDPIEREMEKYRRLERWFHPLRFLHSLPLSHVFGQFMGLWCPALLAAEVHFAEQMEPAQLVDLIKRERISVLVAVPRVLQLLRAHLMAKFRAESSQLPVVSSPEGQRQTRNTTQRTENPQLITIVKKWWRWRRVHRALGWKFWAVISGGATLPTELEAFWSGLGVALIQGYGMTETAALVTLNHPFHIAPGSIGKTLPGREVKIAEDGEILVRGAMLAPAVWQHGAMRQREGEWLATGDLAERSVGGELRFTGRKGDMIVTGAGMNVHPADLEKPLAAQPGVRACVVVGCDFSAGPEAVAVLLFSGSDEEMAAAVKAANAGLAEYQQVRHWLRWPELTLPYTSTGKLIRREVARWACAAVGSSPLSVVSSQERVDALMEVVAEVTGDGSRFSVVSSRADVDRLRLSEDLKLDSLGRVQLQAALEQRFDVELDDDALATMETVGALRRLVEKQLSMVSAQSQGLKSHLASEAERPKPEGRDYLKAGTAAIREAPTPAIRGHLSSAQEEEEAGEQRKAHEEDVYPRWPWWWWVRCIRVAWIECVMRPLIWALAKPRVVFVPEHGTNTSTLQNSGNGSSQLVIRNPVEPRNLNHEPLLIISNHVTAYDGALALYALPGALRRRVACAMSGEMLRDYRHARGQGNWALDALAPGAWLLLTALFNVFPLPRARGYRRSFAHAGAAMDRGYSVLIFPEGSRSRDGKMHAFRAGIGLLAKESGAAILPVGLRGLYDYSTQAAQTTHARKWFHAGIVEVRVGSLLPAADEEADATQLTGRLEKAVRELVEE